MVLSFGKMKDYLQCPKKYYFANIDEFVKNNRKQFEPRSSDLTMGNIVHSVLAKYFEIPQEKRSLGSIKNLLKNTWGNPRGKSGGFDNIEQERDYYKMARSMVEYFYESQGGDKDVLYVTDPEGRESYFKEEIDSDLVLTGRIDRIDAVAPNKLKIIDYKTGSREEDDFQLMLYALIAEKKFGKQVDEASYVYLKTEKESVFSADKSSKDMTLDKTKIIASSIGSDKDFVPKPSKLCGFCPFINLCPAKDEAMKIIAGSDVSDGAGYDI